MMNITATVCPRCKAPLELNLDSRGVDTCKFCDTKLYISASGVLSDVDLSAAQGERKYNIAACEEYSMKSVCPVSERERREKEKSEVCEESEAEARRRLNAARAAIPPTITLEDLFKDEPKSFAQIVNEAVWETLTFPFRALRWFSEYDGDDPSFDSSGGGRRRGRHKF